MSFLQKTVIRTACLCAVLFAVLGPAWTVNLPPATLRDLAARATRSETWPLLRRYAETQKDSTWRGWTYMVVGYQEYSGARYPAAAEDLEKAAKAEFPLADFAVFYQASALNQSARPQEAAALLRSFDERFPHSQLREQALELRASSLMASQQEPAAIDILKAYPDTGNKPGLSLLLGQAYVRIHHALDAAAAFQNVYYRFPLSGQAKAASDALAELRAQMGSAFPVADFDLQTERAEALLKAGKYQDSLHDYNALLQPAIPNPRTPDWQLGQAQCLLRLRRAPDALQALFTHFGAPEQEARRLFLLVQVHAQQADNAAVDQDIAQLDASYGSYPVYADALAAAGLFYYRQLNWQEAARHYRRLWELFPRNEHLREDGWRLAWCNYLLTDSNTSQVMYEYVVRFPDAARVPAALYWMARIQEDHGSPAEARALYSLLIKRFVHSYYALRASARMPPLEARLRERAASGTPDAPLTTALVPLLAPPKVADGLLCAAASPSEAGQVARTLRALDLPDLEEEFLRSALGANHPPPELRLLLAESYSSHDNVPGALYTTYRAVPNFPQLELTALPEEVWSLLYPRAYWRLIQARARVNKLDPYLVMGLIRQESNFDPKALSVANARGLMQILPETASPSRRRRRSVGRRLYDPTYNVRIGCDYLAGLLKQFDGHPELAMAAYNAGDFRVRDWEKKYSFSDPTVFLESIPIPATRNYVEAVLRDAEIYRKLMTGSPRFARCHE